MEFTKLFKTNKKIMLEKWFKITIDTYPEETSKILNKSKNKFDNPVGIATYESLESVLDTLCENMEQLENKKIDAEKLEEALDPVIRIRAVQNFSASDAVGFVFELKDIVKKIAQNDNKDLLDDKFDRQVDQIGLAAFNRFLKCRESIFLLKATEAKNRTYRAFERAGLAQELTDEDLLGS